MSTAGAGARRLRPRPILLRLLGTGRSLKPLVPLLPVLAVLQGCGSQPSQPTHSSSRTNLESIFEAPIQVHADPAGTFAILRRLGVDRVRVSVEWSAVAPDPSSRKPPHHFDGADPRAYPAPAWAFYDQIVRAARAHGVGLLFTLGGPPPLWAAAAGAPPGGPFPQWKPSAAEFGAFVRAVGTRYSGSYKLAASASSLPRVDFWSIWNEPNYGPDLAPQAIRHSTIEVSPRVYRDLLDGAWRGLRASGHGGDTILIGETAPRGITIGNNPGGFSGMVPLRFLRALYCVDSALRPLRGASATVRGCPPSTTGSGQFRRNHPALFEASGFADHPYPQGIPPNVATPDEPDYADLATLPRLEHLLDTLQRLYGSSNRLPIYSTEFGYQTDPPEKIARTTDPATAAYYLNWSEYISWRDPRVRSYDQYLLTDPPLANAFGGFATGLEFKDGTPKATYAAYRMPLYLPVRATSRGGALEVWGCVRPAHYAQLHTGRAQRVQIQFQPGSRGRFKTVRTVTITDPHGYFDVSVPFASSGSVRLEWSYPNGETIHSRLVGVTEH